MPEHIRSLIVILLLSSVIFVVAKRPANELTNTKHYTTQRNVWLILTVLAFLSHDFWLYAIIGGVILLFATKQTDNKIALYFFILFVLPIAGASIPGFGIVNLLFSLTHHRMLALLILLPLFFHFLQQRDRIPFGHFAADKILICYMLLSSLIFLREPSITHTLRSLLYLFTDIFLPYFVISRALRTLPEHRESLLSFVIAAMILALLGIFETYKHWLLYSSVLEVLGLQSSLAGYLDRDGMLRAAVSAGHSIALGYVITLAIGLYLFLQHSIHNRLTRRLGMALLVAGLLASLSRGPWVGAAVLLIVFIATGPYALQRLTMLGLSALVLLPLLSILPYGEKIVELLPFIGTTAQGTITYRENLIENSLIVIQQNPWFGSTNYMDAPEMESMRQGQGIIDIVNTYLQIALISGYVGLALFVSFFGSITWGIYKSVKQLPQNEYELRLLGRALLATFFAILVILATVSSITIIPLIYWSFAGLGVAYIQLARSTQKRTTRSITQSSYG